ncbi:MAG: FlgB family protein [Pseudomonadota bacterium]
MMDDINILKMASAMARHAAARHTILSENLANADTANYKAKDIEPFSDAYTRLAKHNAMAGKDTDFNNDMASWRVESITGGGVMSPNGNNVSIEDQMMRSIEAQQDHQAATAIYRKAMNIVRMTLGRGA